LLQRRALWSPNRAAYTFLCDGEVVEDKITYEQLERRAKSIGAFLQTVCDLGNRVLLTYPPGLDYIAAFFGCMYAGVVAVPAYPPTLNRKLDRLKAIASDADIHAVLTNSQALSRVEAIQRTGPETIKLQWHNTDTLGDEMVNDWRMPDVKRDTPSLLQYTSGSTGSPKGVILTHENLLHNSTLLAYAFEYGPDSCCVSWLPMYHDMGLIGGILQPLYGGFHCILMSPVSFLQKPQRWLSAISRYRATISGGPNFAYDLCVGKIHPEDCAALDLSSWNVAFNGSEPIRNSSIEKFNTVFKSCGFSPEAFFQCYGLAEATLVVSAGRLSEAPRSKIVSSQELENHRVKTISQETETSRVLVSCGRQLLDQKVIIVNPTSRVECRADAVGEIWISGPSVTRGYWGKAEETEKIFNARLAKSEEGPFLRTGDLGFIADDELYVTGRLKDLIIIRGLNHYPHDIEATVQRCHPALQAGAGAAFTIEAEGEERLVVIQEVDRHYKKFDSIFVAIASAVAEEHELQVYGIVLIRPGTCPRTSSGKIQRYLCRADLSEGKLQVSAQWWADLLAPPESGSADPGNLDHRDESLKSWLMQWVATRLGVNSARIDINQPIIKYGLDSLRATELLYDLEKRFGIALPIGELLLNGSITQIIDAKQTPKRSSAGDRHDEEELSVAETIPYPLSYGQRALWFLQKLSPGMSAYNLSIALKISGDLKLAALRDSLQSLVDRHPSLRTVFSEVDGQPVQMGRSRMDASIQMIDVREMQSDDIGDLLTGEAGRPFNLEDGPLLKIYLLVRSTDEHILYLIAHHIIMDLWSLAVLMDELEKLYQAKINNRTPALEPVKSTYRQYVDQQMMMLSGDPGERHLSYWMKQLEGELPALNLPTDKPRPSVQSYRGSSLLFKPAPDLTQDLTKLSRDLESTLNITLLTVFKILLYRYTGVEDILIGSLTAGRGRSELERLVGYFVNPTAIRTRINGSSSFKSYLAVVRRVALGALDHQDYPFALLVEKRQPVRDPSRSPLFQIMFVHQKTYRHDQIGLAGLVLGDTDETVPLNDLTVASFPQDNQFSQFDLLLATAEVGERLALSFQYNTDLFDADTISRMSNHLQTLLRAITAVPESRISELPLLTEAEQGQILELWNPVETEGAEDDCIHTLLEAQAAKNAENTAVIFRGESLSYQELNIRANCLAVRLRLCGIRPGKVVGICLDRSLEMIIGLIAVLKAGGAYLPIDPTYPRQRTAYILEDAAASVILTQEKYAKEFSEERYHLIRLDSAVKEPLPREETDNLSGTALPSDPAYIIYTSGSTGRPKGVVISHRSVVNFFNGMDKCVGCNVGDTLLAVTSISFDISVLELFWTLTRGARILLVDPLPAVRPVRKTAELNLNRGMRYSLFYFASDDSKSSGDKYRLLFAGAEFADKHGFDAVWTPERHFHSFGGLFPNPSLLGAALAVKTKRVQIRAGSVVLPLHNPIRVAEEWSLVDNLSKGRAAVAMASGWHADDFAFFPERYADRKTSMFSGIEILKKLWRGERIPVEGGAGNQIMVEIFPKPVQLELPLWLTAAGSPETFIKAGEMGTNVLTHMLGQSKEELKENIDLYRNSLERHGHDPLKGVVTLMLHTFIGKDIETVRRTVRAPFINYLKSSIGLIGNLVKSLNLSLNLETMSPQDMDAILNYAFDRYFGTGALFGTVESATATVAAMKAIGVNEIACLIDFGVKPEIVLRHLKLLNELKDISNKSSVFEETSLSSQIDRYNITLLQCTPSMMRMLLADGAVTKALRRLRVLMLGGEPLPHSLVKEVKEKIGVKIMNMYGPTETTIWSAAQEIDTNAEIVPIGRPIINTQMYILDDNLQLLPVGVPGELYIGGRGLAERYHNLPGLTADKFMPNPFAEEKGGRLYKSGDLARYLPDGTLDCLGRLDHQVKIRGYRIELGEIERVLLEHEKIEQVAVTLLADSPEDRRLVSYLVPAAGATILPSEPRNWLKEKLPDYMIPSLFITLDALPTTPNGKIDRNALPMVKANSDYHGNGMFMPVNQIERAISSVWQKALKIEKIGIFDNFFDLGGHSLLMAQVHSEIKEILNIDLQLIKTFEYPTVALLAEYIDKHMKEENQRIPYLIRDRIDKQRASFARKRPLLGRS